MSNQTTRRNILTAAAALPILPTAALAALPVEAATADAERLRLGGEGHLVEGATHALRFHCDPFVIFWVECPPREKGYGGTCCCRPPQPSLCAFRAGSSSTTSASALPPMIAAVRAPCFATASRADCAARFT